MTRPRFATRRGPAELDEHHPYAWFFRRVRDLHDLWHVLTGYGRDPLGEVCLLAFTYAQTRLTGLGAIAFLGTFRIARANALSHGVISSRASR